MTATGGAASTAGPQARRRHLAPFLLVGVAVLVGALLVGPPREDGEPLDPTASGPLGALGLVRTLDVLGAAVTTTDGLPGAEVDVALLLVDRLTDDRRDGLRSWVRGGGSLVVADPSSPLVEVGVVGPVEDPRRDDGGCGIESLAEGGALAVEELAVEGVGFDLGVRGRGCLGGDGGSFVVAVPAGDGEIVAVGGAAVWTNGRLGAADNAVLAAALLAPRRGTDVAVLLASPVGAGTTSLVDLVGDGVRQGLVQFALAFVLYALWRGRRLGRPVEEAQPVAIPASALVVAVGDLLQQGHHPQAAADVLRDDARRRFAERLGLAPTAAAADVAEVAARRTGIDADRLRLLLTPAPVGGDDELVAIATDVHSTTEELSRAR